MMPSIAEILFSLWSSSSCYFGRPKLRWKNIRMDLEVLGYDGLDRIHVGRLRVQWNVQGEHKNTF
jgi:hypothetical protein